MSEETVTSSAGQSPPTQDGAANRRPGMVLVIVLALQTMLILDVNVVNIALPDLKEALDFTPTGLSWVLSSYLLTFGGLLLLGGRAGDVLGHRRACSSASPCSPSPRSSAASPTRPECCSPPALCRASGPPSPRRPYWR
ncbi:MFS transporter [Streptomyces atroolivaceus]|uniref:MFS transporter n=1 Tax=Streptomyces atroolivaceus TaxID=66869 RepID=UPI00365791C6